MTEQKNNRLHWLDGMKGAAAVLIFFHHFMLGKFPASFFGSQKPSMLYGVDTLLASCPFLGIIVNGNFFVHLFLLISGYVMAWQTIQMKSERLGLFCFKRYLKLVFAIAVCAAIAFAEFAFNAIKDGQGLGALLKEAHKFFRAIFIDVPFCGDIRIYGPFWMLNYIFLGGIFVALISSLAWVLDGKKVFWAAAVIVLALYASLTAQNVHWASVMLGCALCLFNAFYGVQFGKAALLLLLAALFFWELSYRPDSERRLQALCVPRGGGLFALLLALFRVFSFNSFHAELPGGAKFPFKKSLFGSGKNFAVGLHFARLFNQLGGKASRPNFARKRRPELRFDSRPVVFDRHGHLAFGLPCHGKIHTKGSKMIIVDIGIFHEVSVRIEIFINDIFIFAAV